jgi:hypothetical protein
MTLTKTHKIIIGIVGLGIVAYATKKYWMPKKKDATTPASTPATTPATQSAPAPVTPPSIKPAPALQPVTPPSIKPAPALHLQDLPRQ